MNFKKSPNLVTLPERERDPLGSLFKGCTNELKGYPVSQMKTGLSGRSGVVGPLKVYSVRAYLASKRSES